MHVERRQLSGGARAGVDRRRAARERRGPGGARRRAARVGGRRGRGEERAQVPSDWDCKTVRPSACTYKLRRPLLP